MARKQQRQPANQNKAECIKFGLTGTDPYLHNKGISTLFRIPNSDEEEMFEKVYLIRMVYLLRVTQFFN